MKRNRFLGDEITEINLSDEQKISLVDEIPSLLLNEAPLPVFSLRLFYQLILYAYADFANFIPKSGIIEVLITFVEMQSTEQSNQMLQKQLYPLLSLLWEKCHLDSIFLLLENDFITVSFKMPTQSSVASSDMTLGLSRTSYWKDMDSYYNTSKFLEYSTTQLDCTSTSLSPIVDENSLINTKN